MKLSKIAELLNGELNGPESIEINGPAKIEEAQEGQITFLSNPKYKHFLATTKASAIVIDKNFQEITIPHIRVDDAYVGFLLLLNIFLPDRTASFSGISESAYISKSAAIGDNCRIAPLAYIGNNVKMGKECVIYPGVVILDNVSMGNNCVLYPNVSIREDCIIGKNVIIHNSAVIGSDGFGFAPKDGTYIKIPQIGNVIIEDNVEVGANTTIDRATVGSTKIKAGTKLDNLIQVAHNCVIGENTVIAAQTGMAGSTEIGDNVTIGGQVGIAGHLKVGNKSILAAQSGISKDTGEAAILMGTPSLPIMHRKRIDVCLRHLPENTKKITQMEIEIAELKKELKKYVKESKQ